MKAVRNFGNRIRFVLAVFVFAFLYIRPTFTDGFTNIYLSTYHIIILIELLNLI